jgi:hypothetical protein
LKRTLIRKTEELDDKKISIALMSPFVILIIQYIVIIYFDLIGNIHGNIIKVISTAIVSIFFIFVFPIVIKRSLRKFIIVYSIATIIFLLHYLMYPNNRIYIKELIFPFFFMCLPIFVYSMSLKNWNIFKKIMVKSSNIIFILGIIISILIFLGIGRRAIGRYSMSLSYYMLLPSIIYLDFLLYQFSLKNLFYLPLSLIIILTLGSRGPILCFIIFGILRISRFYFELTYRNIIYYTLSLGIITSIVIFFDKFIIIIYNIFLNFGIKSRTISLYLNEKISHLSGRDDIYSSLLENIVNKPFRGIGLAGDRLALEGRYAHNILVEIYSNFGIFIGSIIILVLFVLVLKAMSTDNKEKYNMIIIWFSLGFVRLMVSSSYLIDIRFWLFLGILLGSFSYKNSSFSSKYLSK